MAKGIIVVDMPETCQWCDCRQIDDCGTYCFSGAYVGNYATQNTKPDWCPIKPLPEKMDYQTRHGLLQEQIMVGWNMCIDAILKGGEIDE